METYNIHRTHLHPLSKVEDFKIARKYPDVRGWSIIGGDGIKLGKVKDLIVNTDQKRVLYLDVNIKKSLFPERKEYQILVPLGVAILNRDDHNVIVPQLTKADLPHYPLYVREPIYVVRSYEDAVRTFFSKESQPFKSGADYYEHEHFDESRFSNPERAKT